MKILRLLAKKLLWLPIELEACRRLKWIKTTFDIYVYPDGHILAIRRKTPQG